MADLVMGAMGNLIPKLAKLAKDEYDLQVGTDARIDSLTKELEGAEAALHKVAEVPWDQLDEQVKLWAREVRDSSYDMEDVLDNYLVQVKGCDSTEKEKLHKRVAKKMKKLFNKGKARHKINDDITDIMTRLDELTKRRHKFKVEDIASTKSTVDPRLAAMYNKVKNLVGIDKSTNELISMLQTDKHGDVPSAKMRIVSVFGVGGLGKTTLVKAVHDKLKGDFGHWAFVPVGRNPDLKKVIQEILIGLDKETYMQFNFTLYSEIHQFINELRDYLKKVNKRYFIVIDDIWEVKSWETIQLAFDDEGNCGGRIIITTRKLEVAIKADEFYKLQPLCDNSSRELFYTRMFGDQRNRVNNQRDETSNKILKKCGGIPLAIITMASLLVGKPKDKWFEIYKNIGFGSKETKEEENSTTRILSYSYYDLPLHLRTCLLYLSAFPEDSFICKTTLVWKWVAEGFVREEKGIWLFETGVGYFNNLINKSLIEAVEDDDDDGIIIGCRIHDIVLDFIRSVTREENFSTIVDNDQDTPLQTSHVRRLVHHNRTMRHTHQADHSDAMPTVRSFSALVCAIESWVPLSSFTRLRVLAIENCNLIDGCRIRIENVSHLVHLRYLSLWGTRINTIPEKIRDLSFLETLDLWGSDIVEMPSSSSLPEKLKCLRISFHKHATPEADVPWVGVLTSLEELLIEKKFQWKELGKLGELRVLNAGILGGDESERDFVKSVSHLNKLQHLAVEALHYSGSPPKWTAAGLALPHQLQHLAVYKIKFHKLPSCINPSSLPNLSHLDLRLDNMDDHDLNILCGLPELGFLKLQVEGCSAAINNASGNNVVYFPKLRCCKLRGAMVLLFGNIKDNNVSFHLWDGSRDIDVPCAAAPDENEGTIFGIGASAPSFMPSLKELCFEVRGKAARNHHYCNSLGWKYLSSLQKISVEITSEIYRSIRSEMSEKVEEGLRHAADEHPNHPALHIILHPFLAAILPSATD